MLWHRSVVVYIVYIKYTFSFKHENLCILSLWRPNCVLISFFNIQNIDWIAFVYGKRKRNDVKICSCTNHMYEVEVESVPSTTYKLRLSGAWNFQDQGDVQPMTQIFIKYAWFLLSLVFCFWKCCTDYFKLLYEYVIIIYHETFESSRPRSF